MPASFVTGTIDGARCRILRCGDGFAVRPGRGAIVLAARSPRPAGAGAAGSRCPDLAPHAWRALAPDDEEVAG